MEQNLVLSACKVILETHFGASFNIKLEQYSQEKLGYLADHFLLTATSKCCDNPLKQSFFVKTFPKATYEVMKKYVQQANVFAKEIFVYELYIPAVKKYLQSVESIEFAPKYFGSKTGEVVVLENLKNQDYKLANSEILDVAHIQLALKTLAQYHAVSLAYEEVRTASSADGTQFKITDEFPEEFKDGINRKDEDFTGYQYLKAAHKGVLTLIDILPQKKLTKKEFKIKVNKTFEDIFVLLSTSVKYRNVLCHGDLWYKNIMFQYENDKLTKCKLIDFQLIRYSPPANDVLFFLLHSSNSNNLNFDYYLRIYYDFLKESLDNYNIKVEKILPRNQFKDTCEIFLPPLKLKHVYHNSLSAANCTDYMKNAYSDPELYTKTLFHDRSEMITYLIHTDESYKKKMIVEIEALEYIFTLNSD